jgi:cardiolipin synthase
MENSNQKPTKNINIPIVLTILRIMLCPAIFFYSNIIILLSIVFIGGLTDFLDGYIARKYNKSSKLGSILDPVADKLFFNSLLLKLFQMNLIPLYIFVGFLAKDVVLIVGWIALNLRKSNSSSSNPRSSNLDLAVTKEIKPLLISKISTSLIGLGVLLILINQAFPNTLINAFINNRTNNIIIYLQQYCNVPGLMALQIGLVLGYIGSCLYFKNVISYRKD